MGDVCIGNYAKYYTASGFLRKNADEEKFVKKMTKNYSRVETDAPDEGQKEAWKD